MAKLNPVFTPYEHEEQVRFCKEFELAYPQLHYFAIPNGGKRSKKTALDLQAEGVKPGVPDLFIPEHLLWIEFKRQKQGVLSPEQKIWIAHLEAIGHQVIVARGCDDAMAQVGQLLAQKGVRPFAAFDELLGASA
jgi:hypothetical protein